MRKHNNRPNFPPRMYRLPEKKGNDYGIGLKEFIIPILSAALAILLNQIFFENNQKVEAKIELEMEMFKAQVPVLNRILAFTHKYEVAVSVYHTVPSKVTQYINKNTNKIVKTDTILLTEQTDTTKLTVPSFITVESKRKRLLNDIETLKKIETS